MPQKIGFSTLFTVVIAVILSSCAVQKRQYMRGYHISSNNSKSKNKKQETVKSFRNATIENISLAPKTIIVSSSESAEIILASNTKNPIIVSPAKKIRLNY